ncbi:S24 family peptidase [Streptococcus suis]|uniref:S24 family peptidase n=1 Tax=Streptococcus suis TaxID=1307 RepID=UPI00240E04DD|nr:S24 family peptidase [Streptococcus suis]WFA75707.1 S24 family peptidase [Streptococcus suis]
MKNILGNSIRELRKSKKMTQVELAKKTGYKQNTISNHENGNRQLDEQDILKYAKALEVEPQVLFDLSRTTTEAPNSLLTEISGKVVYLDQELKEPRHSAWISHGERLLDEQNTVENSKNTVSELQSAYYTYNYYDQPASAGTGQYLNDVKVETIELPVNVNADFVVPIYGDSMEPEYHSGDYVFVKLSVDLSDGDIGVFAYNGEAYIKQLRITDQGAYLHSLNPDYDNIPITADTDFRTIGEIVEVYRER